ncbi:hypothetical protein IMZ48_19530 [Candidatus Bathyarchaeota archaeon]|nr:hypothetical protein [Candidatus Bathyarchaeota archaeon]
MASDSKAEQPTQGGGPWVRYRVEYRDNATGELISELYAQNQKESLEQEESRDHHHVVMDEPIFELMTIYQARRSVGSTRGESSVSFLTMSHTMHLTIYSPAIINALQSVVKYYPSQDLSGNPLTINYPYAVLAHHYDELDAFRETCATKAPDKMCAREEHASEHLALLIKFLDNSIMKDVRLEMERNKEGIMTWEYAWVGYKPGATRVQRFRGDKDYNASVVHSVSGGIFDSPPTVWNVKTWSLQFDGSLVGTKTQVFEQGKFDGESYENNEVYMSTEDFLEAVETKSLSEQGFKKIEYGKAWWKLLTKQCKHYKGKTRDYPHNEVSHGKQASRNMHYS